MGVCHLEISTRVSYFFKDRTSLDHQFQVIVIEIDSGPQVKVLLLAFVLIHAMNSTTIIMQCDRLMNS